MFQALLYLPIDLKEPKVPEYFENAIDHGAPIIQVIKHCVGTSNVYDLQKELRAHILQDHTKQPMLELAVRIKESDEEIKHSIQHEDAIEYIQQTQVASVDLTFKTDDEENKDDVQDKDDQREIVPYHLPVVVRMNNEPRNSHLLFFSVLRYLLFLLFINIFEDLIASNIVHHSYNFDIASDKLPLDFGSLDFLLFLRVLLEQLFKLIFSLHFLMLFGIAVAPQMHSLLSLELPSIQFLL